MMCAYTVLLRYKRVFTGKLAEKVLGGGATMHKTLYTIDQKLPVLLGMLDMSL